MRNLSALLFAAGLCGCAAPSQQVPDPARAAEVNTQLGIGYFESGRFDLALEKLEDAAGYQPEYIPALVMLGLVNERLGRTDLAQGYYRRAAALAPDDGATQNTYGAFLCRTGEIEQAERRFIAAAENPGYATPEVAWGNAGACARRIPDEVRAQTYFRRALKIQPDFPDVLYHMADLHYQQGDLPRARSFLQRLEDASGLAPEVLMLGFRIESALHNEASAAQYAERLESGFPDSEEAYAVRTIRVEQNSPGNNSNND